MAEKLVAGAMPSAKKIIALRNADLAHKGRIDEERGKRGALWAAAEKDGVHRAAAKVAFRLAAMDPVSQSDWLAHFDLCCETLGVGRQTELFEEDKPRKSKRPTHEAAQA